MNALKIPTVKTIKKEERLINYPFISKPEYGAGSDNVVLHKNKNHKIKKSFIFQKFYPGKKGSFLMLCKNGKNKVICCNEQIVKLET